MRSNNYKKYRDVEDQIKYLEIHKKIIVEDDNKKLFLERNYIELINPYKELIYQGKTATGKHIYKEDVYFSSIKSLVEIDDWICQNLFILIRRFEKRFRNTITLILSDKYSQPGKYWSNYGITYIDDIQDVIKEGDKDYSESVIAPNINVTLSKEGKFISDNPNRIISKADLLAKIKIIGTCKDQRDYKTNGPINNAILSQKTAPFWLVTSALNFGDLQRLFELQDSKTMKKIYRQTLDINDDVEVSNKDIFKFLGKIETVRKMRNTVNHYLPIFPLLLDQIPKKVQESQILATIKMLKSIKDSSLMKTDSENLDYLAFIGSLEDNTFGIKITNYNKKKFEMVKAVVDLIIQTKE